jgi:hypothetical protein
LSADEWQEEVLGPNPNLERFFKEMGELYGEMATRLCDAAGQRLRVGMGGVLEGSDPVPYWVVCCDQERKLLYNYSGADWCSFDACPY